MRGKDKKESSHIGVASTSSLALVLFFDARSQLFWLHWRTSHLSGCMEEKGDTSRRKRRTQERGLKSERSTKGRNRFLSAAIGKSGDEFFFSSFFPLQLHSFLFPLSPVSLFSASPKAKESTRLNSLHPLRERDRAIS